MIRIFGHYVALRAVLIACFEVAAILAIYDAITMATIKLALGQGVHELYGQKILIGTGCLTLWLTAAACGMYNADVIADTRNVAGRLIAVSIISYFVTAILISIVEATFNETVNLKLYYAINLGASLGYFFVALIFRINVFARQVPGSILERRTIVLGVGELAEKAAQFGMRRPSPYHIVGFVPLAEPQCARAIDPNAIISRSILDQDTELLNYARTNRVDEVVFASRERRGMPTDALMACKLGGVLVTNFPDFWERQTGQVDLDSLNPGWMIFSDGFTISRRGTAIKRAFDIFVGTLLLTLALPICVIAAIAIKLDSPGPIFYRQVRVGQYGRNFSILKFRSMRQDAEKDGRAIWAQAGDSRVTRVGEFIRRTRIDEIPQVLNVLAGEMSFVGPRPERPVFVDALTQRIPFYNVRHQLKPGITGWAQIWYPYGASDEDAKAKLAYDLYYVKNRNLFLDLVILFQTVRVVLWREGSR